MNKIKAFVDDCFCLVLIRHFEQILLFRLLNILALDGLGLELNISIEGVHVTSSGGNFCVFLHTSVYALPS